MSCSDNTSTTNGGTTNPGNGNNQNNISVIPSGSITPSSENVKNSIVNGFDLNSVAKTYSVNYIDNTFPSSSTNFKTNSGGKTPAENVKSFFANTSSDGLGFSFNLEIIKPAKFASFAAYNAGSKPTPGSSADAAKKFIFGDGVTTSLLNKTWLSTNGIDSATSTITWAVDDKAQDEASKINPESTMILEYKDGTTDALALGSVPGFVNKNVLEFNPTNAEKAEKIIKTGYVILTINAANQNGSTGTAFNIPIAFNVIYDYEPINATKASSVFANSSTDPVTTTAKISGSTLSSAHAAYVTNSDTNPNNWQTTNVANWQVDTIGSSETQNILNVRVDSQEDIKVAIPAFKATDLINSTANNSILNPQWLLDNGFIDNANTPSASGISLTWEPNNGQQDLAVSGDVTNAQYIYTKTPIKWEATNINTKSSRAYQNVEYSIYSQTSINLTITKPNIKTQIIPVTLRFVAPASPFMTNVNVLSSINNAIVTGNSSTNLENAKILNGASFEANSINPTRLVAKVINAANGCYGIKQLSGSELINSGLINKTWLEQSGFDANSKFTWLKDSIDTTYGTSNIPIKFVTKTINGAKYYVNDAPITWLVDDDKTVNLPLQLEISNGTITKTIYTGVDIKLAPDAGLTKSWKSHITSSTQANNLFETSNTGPSPIDQAPSYTNVSDDTKIQLATGSTVVQTGLSTNNISLLIKNDIKWFKFHLPDINALLDQTLGTSATLLSSEFINFYDINDKNTVASWELMPNGINTATSVLGINFENNTLYNIQSKEINATNFGSKQTGIIQFNLVLTKTNGAKITVPVQFNIEINATISAPSF